LIWALIIVELSADVVIVFFNAVID
jgi:hypothetical protein